MALNLEWHKGALCSQVDPEIFFPEVGSSYTSQTAKKVCGQCDVKQQCLDFALERREQHGVWGGTAPADRYRLLREQDPNFRWPNQTLTNPFDQARGGPWLKDAKTCSRGHELNDENLQYAANGDRRCRVCKKLNDDRRKKRLRQQNYAERTA